MTTKASRKTKAVKSAKATKPRRFAPSVIAAIDEAGIPGIRAGARSDHRFTGVWPVVVDGRVFARSWTVKPDGWAGAFLDDPLGTLQIARLLHRQGACRDPLPDIARRQR